MAMAFELNADAVELDVHSTIDGKIVVFHDWTLESRTNGKGVTQEQTFDYLRSLDIGYGYTADNHKTHPFRCNPASSDYAECIKRNQMPTLREVLQAFPYYRFVINMKSASEFTLNTLVAELRSISNTLGYNLRNLSFYCSKQEINERMKKLVPELDVPKLTMGLVKDCLTGYFKEGSFQDVCRDSFLPLPFEDFEKLGQLTEKLTADAHDINAKIGVVRVDTEAAYQHVTQYNIDRIWTDRIDAIGPLVKFDQVDTDVKVYDNKVREMKDRFQSVPANPSDKNWVKAKLAHMVEVDQYMRKYLSIIFDHAYSPKEERYFWRKFGERWKQVDRQNTSDLKALLETYPWFTITEFGPEADINAWLLVQHADHDPDFQKSVLTKLEKLYRVSETKPANYAYLFDRVAASWHDLSKRTLQRYGTQGTCVAPGKWEPIPMEEPSKIDVRRKEIGLGALAEYMAEFKEICK